MNSDFSVPDFKLFPVTRDFIGSTVKNLWHLEQLGLKNVWETTKGSGIKIAILDSGFAPHEEISNVKESISFVLDEDEIDYAGHGTSVIGILGSKCKELCGICPESEIYSLKILNRYIEGNFDSLYKALEWCLKNKPDIINLSISSKTVMPPNIKQILEELYNQNIIICASTGNDSSEISYPAKYESVFSIGAYDRDGNIAAFSNRGNEIDFSAPGVDIYTCSNKNNGYVHATGTSFASPIFAGIVSLILSKHTFESINQLKTYLVKHVKDMGEKGWDKFYGWGSIIPETGIEISNDKTSIREEKIILGTKQKCFIDDLLFLLKSFNNLIGNDKNKFPIYHKN
jgi:minor extracellular protease Epr